MEKRVILSDKDAERGKSIRQLCKDIVNHFIMILAQRKKYLLNSKHCCAAAMMWMEILLRNKGSFLSQWCLQI